MFFPEGTSTDAMRVLPFKSTLFAAFYTHGLDQILHIQPVTVVYHAPTGAGSAVLRLVGRYGVSRRICCDVLATRSRRAGSR